MLTTITVLGLVMFIYQGFWSDVHMGGHVIIIAINIFLLIGILIIQIFGIISSGKTKHEKIHIGKFLLYFLFYGGEVAIIIYCILTNRNMHEKRTLDVIDKEIKKLDNEKLR